MQVLWGDFDLPLRQLVVDFLEVSTDQLWWIQDRDSLLARGVLYQEVLTVVCDDVVICDSTIASRVDWALSEFGDGDQLLKCSLVIT